jgi:hypothetical protein
VVFIHRFRMPRKKRRLKDVQVFGGIVWN